MARYQLASKKRKEHSGAGRGLVAGVAGFAVLCGLLLLLVGAPGLSCNTGRTTTARALSALESINRADRDLEAGNYGNARTHVKAAQEALTEVLQRLHGSPD